MRGAFQIAGGLAKRVCLGGIAISFAGLLACGPDTKDEDDMEPSSEAPAAAAVATPKIEAIEITRASIPDGQMILADDPAFAAGEGWDAAFYEPDGSSVWRWMIGPSQRVTWPGPAKPGSYFVKASFYRSNPFPDKEIEIEYRLPGMAEWAKATAPLGGITLESLLTTTEPDQTLTAEFKTPTWLPSERIPGSNDPRPLGMQFLNIAVSPGPATASTGEGAPPAQP